MDMPENLETAGKIFKAEEDVDHLASSLKFRTVPLLDRTGQEVERYRGGTNNGRDLCEFRLGMIGAFAVGEDSVTQMVFSSRGTGYEITATEVMAVLGLGLDRLSGFDSEEGKCVDFMLKDKDAPVFFDPEPSGARLLSGVQAMFDTVHGELRPELVFSRELEDSSHRVRDYYLDLSRQYPGLAEHNTAVTNLTNPRPDNLARVTLALAQSLLPDSIEESYG